MGNGVTVDDVKLLTELNEQFIDAWRKGSWDLIQPILAPTFQYLDGTTGEVTDLREYEESIRAHPVPTISIDQVVVHVAGDTAVVSARSTRNHERYTRYVDTYARTGEGWHCVHASLWPLPQ
jgi:Domain of unknown function (DUF4440)